jgi:hypothetical protein
VAPVALGVTPPVGITTEAAQELPDGPVGVVTFASTPAVAVSGWQAPSTAIPTAPAEQSVAEKVWKVPLTAHVPPVGAAHEHGVQARVSVADW